MSDIVSTEPLHGRIAGLVKHLKGEYPPHVLADVSEAATLIEEQAARIAELQAELEREKKETERLDGAWHALHERMAKDNEAHARYFEKSQARIHELFDAEAASQARLSEAVKVLEGVAEAGRLWNDRQNMEAFLMISNSIEAAKAFITTLGGEK